MIRAADIPESFYVRAAERQRLNPPPPLSAEQEAALVRALGPTARRLAEDHRAQSSRATQGRRTPSTRRTGQALLR